MPWYIMGPFTPGMTCCRWRRPEACSWGRLCRLQRVLARRLKAEPSRLSPYSTTVGLSPPGASMSCQKRACRRGAASNAAPARLIRRQHATRRADEHTTTSDSGACVAVLR